tara:strand:- start:3686 stop:6781 length:3096 start_codon:yes stop_codon:yes gene_type:complete
MAEVNLTLGDPIEVKVTPAEGATNVTVASAPQNVVQVQAAIATNGLQGADGAGVPTSPPGAKGQALVKSSPVANATEWAYIDKLHATVKNTTGSTISAGSLVYAAGVDGSDILVALADASDSSKMPAIGFVFSDIAHNGTGDVVVAGSRTQDIQSVTGADEGKIMYVSSSTPGAVTVTKPSGSTNFVQSVGVVLRADGTTIKEFKVSCVDATNDIPNLDSGHFFLGGAANTTSPYELPTSSPTNGQLLKADANGNLVFVDASNVTKNIGTVNLTTTETTRNLDIIENGHLNIRDAQDATILYIDEANKRVGINTTTVDKPAALFVNGDVLFKNSSTIGVEGGQSFTIGKIGSAAGVATVNVTGDLSVSGNSTIDTNLKFGTGGNQLHANTNNTFEFGKNGSGSANYKFNSDVGTVTFENTTDVELKNAGGLKLFNGSNSIAVKSPSLSGSYTLTLPNSSGTDGHVLKTDGSGTTSWVDVTAVSDAILDSDFSGSSGLMKKASAGTYEIATANTDYQLPPSEGAFANGDKTKLDYITVGSAINLGQAVLTTTSDVSSASFVDTDDTFGSPTNNLVPSQLAVKTYVDSHVKTAIYSDASDNPQLASGVTAGEVRALIDLEDSDIRTKISHVQNSASGNGTLSYNQSSGVISYTPPDLSSYLTSAPPVTLANTNYLSLNGQELTGGTVPIGSGGTGATSVAAAKVNLSLEDSDIRAKFSAGTGISYNSSTGVIATTASSVDELNDLSDVSVSSESQNQYLVRNTDNNAFVNRELDISHDPTPVLGGHLDVGANEIRSTTSNGNIIIQPNGTGNVKLGTLEFDADQSIGAGQDNHVLTYDNSSGLISLEAASSASGTVDTTGTPSQNQISYFSDADTIQGSNILTFDGNELTLKGKRLYPNPTTGDTFFGDIVNFGSGPNGVNGDIEQGKLYYLDTSLQWEEADANAVASAKGMLGIAIDNDTPKFLIRGIARHSSWTNLGNGSVLYISAGVTTGEIANSAPQGQGDVVRVIGYCTNSGAREIFFNPSNDWIELA